jgi:nucleotide-binding universal stress UspA family protein
MQAPVQRYKIAVSVTETRSVMFCTRHREKRTSSGQRIVIIRRGLGAISRTLMGSLSDSVVCHAHYPVFVMHT